MQIASNFSLLTRRAVQLLSLKEEQEQVVFSFELGPHAPRISEGIVRSKQGGGESLFCKLCWLGARQREQCDRDHSHRLLRASVIQQQTIQPLRWCPEDCFAGGKERSLSTPLVWPTLQFSLSSRFEVSSWNDWFMLSRCAQCDGFVFWLPRCARTGK